MESSVKHEIKSKCLVELFIETLGSKWKILIIWHLRNSPLRFTDLQKKMHNVNSNTLTFNLRELENQKIITRTIFPEIPPRVEYALTEHGKALFPVFDAIRVWGAEYLESEGMTMDVC
ncbi:winged helix-turn-helix transcriptional regulator [Methanospirillum lacunae]|uniref:Transcriptional regulator n=1 Tax=Methanospirillum lacunae TaxID=668570 RepID=A0A2V2MVN3_9EURY|nr:helix-turn-helix domain-containing protein [Methanospirillum lacunae]PWR70350.1 transcriptional regulator [Methanospirillum lacunae]